MDQGPLVIEEIDAGAELIRQYHELVPVKAAFWLKDTDRFYRRLYIASEEITDENIRTRLAELFQLMKQIPNPLMESLRVRLIPANDPLALAAARINESFPVRNGVPFWGDFFGNLNVDDVYIYPAPLKTVSTMS